MSITKRICIWAICSLSCVAAFNAQAATIEYRSCGVSCTSLDALSDITLDLGSGSKRYDMFIAWGETFSQAIVDDAGIAISVSIPLDQGYAFWAIQAVDQALRDLDYYIVADHSSIFLNMAYGPESGGRYASYWIALNDSDTVAGTFVARSGSGSVSATGASVYPLVFFTEVSQVPVPAAAWLFGSALIGLAGIKRKK